MKITVGGYYKRDDGKIVTVVEPLITHDGEPYVSLKVVLPTTKSLYAEDTEAFLLTYTYFCSRYTKLNKLQRTLLL